MNPKLNCIAAACANMGIGKNNDLPWRLKSEMEYFTRMTSKTSDLSKKNIVLMGRKTWESIPPKYKPLKNRINFVLSSKSDLDFSGFKDVYGFQSLEDVVNKLVDENFKNQYENIWVVGGAQIYKMVMDSPYFHRLYLTRILEDFECDTFFPELPKHLKKISHPDVPQGIQSEKGVNFEYHVYENEKIST